MALTDVQQTQFMAALPSAMPYAAGEEGRADWHKRRDRAILSMLLGAGVKVPELICLFTEDVGVKDSTGSVPITIDPDNGIGAKKNRRGKRLPTINQTLRAHRTQLRPFAAQEVLNWVEERQASSIPGKLLFASTMAGTRMDQSTVYLLCKATFERAGIDAVRMGPRTLRNSFAVRELESKDGSAELAGEFLVHREKKSIEPYFITKKTRDRWARAPAEKITDKK